MKEEVAQVIHYASRAARIRLTEFDHCEAGCRVAGGLYMENVGPAWMRRSIVVGRAEWARR